jgi:uncharacterized protein (TIGR02246 family)
MAVDAEIEELYRALLARWNERDAAGYAAMFTENGSLVGFDGSCVERSTAIGEHLEAIFADHQPASYVAKVREIRQLAPGTVLLRSVAGMVPPNGNDINPDVNAVQSLLAVVSGNGWRIAHFQNTPAAFHGRPQQAEALTLELRSELAKNRR